jgi:hypothetical protein
MCSRTVKMMTGIGVMLVLLLCPCIDVLFFLSNPAVVCCVCSFLGYLCSCLLSPATWYA